MDLAFDAPLTPAILPIHYRLFFASKFLLLGQANPFICNLFRPLTSFL